MTPSAIYYYTETMTTAGLKSRKEISPFATEYKFVLIVNNTAVAYLKLLSKDEYQGMASLCTIETRPGYQGKGYAAKILQEAATAINTTIGTTGGFTPEGFKAFNGKLPRIANYPAATKPTFESMTFIENWETEFNSYV